MTQVAFGTYQWREGEQGGAEVAAAVEALCRDADKDGFRDFVLVEDLRAALADPAGALAKHDAEVLRAAAGDLCRCRGCLGHNPDCPAMAILDRADRIEGQL